MAGAVSITKHDCFDCSSEGQSAHVAIDATAAVGYDCEKFNL